MKLWICCWLPSILLIPLLKFAAINFFDFDTLNWLYLQKCQVKMAENLDLFLFDSIGTP